MRWGNVLGGAGLLLAWAALPVSLSHGVPAAAASQFVYGKRYAMGTVYEIVAYDASLDRASRAMDVAFRKITDLDRMMSNYDTQSDLRRMERSAHFHPVRVSPDLYRVIQDSLLYSRLSGGKYDITVAPLVDVWKSAMNEGRVPSPARLKQLRACVGYWRIQLIPPGEIALRSPCMRLDLGSIGKGYAVDRAIKILRSSGIRDALVNAGGSTIYGLGSPPGQHGWTIRLNDPSSQVRPEVTLRDDSVSTSGQETNSLIFAGESGHIIDPTTAQPMRSAFSVSVIAKTATASDGLSTTLFLLGPDSGTRVVHELPGTAALWVSPKGETRLASTGPKILVHRIQKSSAAADLALERPQASVKR
jgi:thiamine biosynthesis lipoprotein